MNIHVLKPGLNAKSEEHPNIDMWGDLVKFAESLHVDRDIISDGNIIKKEVWKPIFILSYEPFQVAWTTLKMADQLKKMSQVQKPLVAHIDSTGISVCLWFSIHLTLFIVLLLFETQMLHNYLFCFLHDL